DVRQAERRRDDARGFVRAYLRRREHDVDLTAKRFGSARGFASSRVGERRIGAALPAFLGVPHRLGVADEKNARHSSWKVEIMRAFSVRISSARLGVAKNWRRYVPFPRWTNHSSTTESSATKSCLNAGRPSTSVRNVFPRPARAIASEVRVGVMRTP